MKIKGRGVCLTESMSRHMMCVVSPAMVFSLPNLTHITHEIVVSEEAVFNALTLFFVPFCGDH